MTTPGSRFGHYTVLRALGAGGMGQVFLARDERLGREVALKMLPPQLSQDRESLHRFRREALTLASLNHPNIAVIHGFEEGARGALALVLERVEGETLADRLGRGPMPVADALQVCVQIAEALEVAHERGVVHRDLKPGNVMLAPRGLVKVLDFGLARRLVEPAATGGVGGASAAAAGPPEAGPALDRADTIAIPRPAGGVPGPDTADTIAIPAPPGTAAAVDAADTLAMPSPAGAAMDGADTIAMPSPGAGEAPVSDAGVVSGTPGYMSPEQVRGSEQDHRTDVFAFGCVLFECLSGARAFQGPTAIETMRGALEHTVDLAALPERIPGAVRELIGQCLEKDPAQRPDDMRSVRIAIEEALGIRRAAALRAGERAETPHNLPRPLTSFVGRAGELERCRSELAATRLLTLLGMGGSGKTRLALRLAETVLDEHPDGVWFVDLSALRQPERVVEAVAEAVGVREEPVTPLEQTLTRHLGDRQVLVVMDNCEEVLAGCRPLATRLLAACGGLRIVATSREALGAAGEVVHPVPPLGIPTGVADEDPAATEAVQLFTARAGAARADFALTPQNTMVVIEICRRLDGIPLALELAAARVRVLGVEQILARLGDRFRLLTASGAGGDGRHQTLRAVIQWSADHLEPEELRLFRTLSVFVGAWSLESALAVGGEDQDEFEVLDTLQRLADKSLVVLGREASGDARYRYLETVRQLAGELREAAGEGDACRDRHLAWFLAAARETDTQLAGAGQRRWLSRLDVEHEDVLAAHAWAGGRAGGIEAALVIAGAMARYWSLRGHHRLARRTLEDTLARAAGTAASPAYAMASVRAATFAVYEGDYEATRLWLERSLALYREWGDERGVARVLTGLGTVAECQRDYASARACIEEALAWYRRKGERHATGLALANLGSVVAREGNYAQARRLFEEAAGLFDGSGDQRLRAHALSGLALALTRLGERAAASAHLTTALQVTRELGAQVEAAYGLDVAAELAAASGEDERALCWLAAAGSLWDRMGTPRLPADRDEEEGLRQTLGQRMGAQAAEAAATRGRALPMEEALAEALGWLGSVGSGRAGSPSG